VATELETGLVSGWFASRVIVAQPGAKLVPERLLVG
jgi:hypothetical protein